MSDRTPPEPISPDAEYAPAPKHLVFGLVAALVAWGLYLAIGAAYWGHNIWRGVVVLACSALFLGWFWGLQRLFVRRQRK